jgi:NitT/TauT family transport system permease protein
MTPKVVNAILLSSLPMAVIMLNSLTDTRDEYLKLMESWRSSRIESFFLCRLPAAVPQIVGGVRVAMPLALIGAVLGEFLGGSGGLGYVIVSSGSAFRVDRIFAAITVLAIGGTLIVASIDLFRFSFLKRFYQSSGGSNVYD